MKRQQLSPPTEDLALHWQVKKAKTTNDTTMAGDSAFSSNDDGGWTKVEKRKKPSSDMRIPALHATVPVTSTSPMPGASAKAEKRKQKKVKKAEAAVQPRFMYNNAEIVKRNYAIGIEEIRDLVLHILSDAPPPNWLRVDNASLIDRVVAILVPGLTPSILSLPPISNNPNINPNVPISIPLLPRSVDTSTPQPNVPFIAATFSHACPTRAPGDLTRMHSVLSAFFQTPISGEEKKRRIAKRLASESTNTKDPKQYILTVEQMIENDYPIPSYMADVFQKPEGWLETPKPDPQGEKEGGLRQRVYAIDCEMCLTEDGKELARVSVIEFHSGNVVYDTLVRPAKPIVDYLTRWSGITPQALASVTTTHAEVQMHVMSLLSPSTPPPNPFRTPAAAPTSHTPPPTPILLGHSLESDLKALKISHPYCIDTALLFHHPRGRPLKPGLAWLTKKWCGREIQTRGEGGHDPEEDARACIELVKRKMENGPGWGEFRIDVESLFERMGRGTRRSVNSIGGDGGGGESGTIRSAVVDYGNPGAMHGNKATTAVQCTSDEEVVKGILDAVQSHHFVFGRMMKLADVSGWTTQKNSDSLAQPPPATPSPPSPEDLQAALSNLDTHLKSIHAALPPRTAFVIFTGHSDPRSMSALNQRKNAFETLIKSGMSPEQIASGAAGEANKDVRWTSQDGRELEGEVELAKRGLAFLGVKQ